MLEVEVNATVVSVVKVSASVVPVEVSCIWIVIGPIDAELLLAPETAEAVKAICW